MNGKLSGTAAVIRSYNNPNITKSVKKMLDFGVGKALVVVNGPPDKSTTRGYLSEVKDSRLSVLEMAEGYSWANALNLSLFSVNMHNTAARAKGKHELRFVLNASVEALFEKEHLERMLDEATDDPRVLTVGTSFKGRQEGNWTDLGRSYRHPRNTGMLIRIEALGQLLPGFNPWCDGIGGMEDIEFVLRMLALSGLEYRMLDLQVPLVVGKHYHQPTKEAREQEAMDKIIAFWRGLFPVASPERFRIEVAIGQMGLEATPSGLNIPLAVGTKVTWTNEALERVLHSRDLYDRALVIKGSKLVLTKNFIPGDQDVEVNNGNGNFPANPGSLRPINE